MSTVPANEDTFDRLLAALPQIADAVNAFDTKSTKRLALEAPIHALGVDPATTSHQSIPATEEDHTEQPADLPPTTPGQEVPEQPGVVGSSTKARTPRKKAAPTPLQPLRDLDFWPTEGSTLQELVDEKRPASIDHKNTLVIFWFQEFSDQSQIGAAHVLAAYRAMKWKEPKDLINSLQATASRTHWINTSDMKSLSVTPGGRNLVNHTLPVARKTTKAAA